MQEDPVSRVASPLLLILLMVIVPLLIGTMVLDVSQRSTADNAVQEFSQEARSTGYISQANYQNLVTALSTTNKSYTVKMLHRAKTATPVYGNDGKATGKYTTTYVAYNQDDIFTKLDDGEDYVMKNGDFFDISVASQQPMTGFSYFGAFTGQGPNLGMKIICKAGGMVGNTKR